MFGSFRSCSQFVSLLVSPITAKWKCIFHTESMLPVTSQGVIVPWEHYEIHTSSRQNTVGNNSLGACACMAL